MMFIVSTPEGNVAVPEATFFAAVKRHVVHGDPCAEFQGFVVQTGGWDAETEAVVGDGWTVGATHAFVTASDCWKRLQELHDEMWVVGA